jgi:hypothetical protein
MKENVLTLQKIFLIINLNFLERRHTLEEYILLAIEGNYGR